MIRQADMHQRVGIFPDLGYTGNMPALRYRAWVARGAPLETGKKETMTIETKMMPWQLVVSYYGPTDARGARYKVTSGSAGKGARFFHYDYAAADARLVAAVQYMAALGYAPDLYRLEHAAVYETSGRSYNFYSVTRTGVEL